MLTTYRGFYKPGDVVNEDSEKAKQLVDLGRAEYIDVEKEAPRNKEARTARKVAPGRAFSCNACPRSFTSERGLKIHLKRLHG